MAILDDITLGDPLTRDWRHINDLKRVVRRLDPEAGRLSNRVASADAATSGGEGVEQLLVVDTSLPDILECVPLLRVKARTAEELLSVGDAPQRPEWAVGVSVYVAKPFRLRRSPFDGRTLATDGRLFSGNVAGVEVADGTRYLLGDEIGIAGAEIIAGTYYAYTDANTRTANNGSESEEQTIVPPWLPNLDYVIADRVTWDLGLYDPSGAPVTLLARADARAWSA